MAAYLHDADAATSATTSRTKPVTLTTLRSMHQKGEKISMLTSYDASFTALFDRCGVETILVGDSLGMVCQGHNSTLPVTLQDVVYHTACVARGNHTAFILADMPFGTYSTPEQACANAVQLIQAGAQMIKIEGGAWLAPTVRFLTERAIPICAHIGLTPQSVHQMGGYKVQGKTNQAAEQLKAVALALQAAGAEMVVLEAIPAALGKEVTAMLTTMSTIGIGAGPDCSGQVLVLHDVLGVFPGHKAKFVKNFMEGQTSIDAAVKAYVAAVKDGSFPAAEQCF
ncbi:MAG: 3-methyl-2-oxobutanoate hydroxymethyltransferase [Glaciimonas sp.]|nr:3-methyl-2-oxobutanoate hydroxymethyltransferase [Glaciimonas sp.]